VGDAHPTTDIDEFLIGEGNTVFVELNIIPVSPKWIIDASGRSKIYSDECIKSSASVWIHAKVDGVGLQEIGPFHVHIGNETIESNKMKVYILPKLDQSRDLIVMGKRDPNGKDLYQIKIEYKIIQKRASSE
jgi:hypothetical protein